MSPADAFVGWCLTNAALITIGVFAVALWSQYDEQRFRYRTRTARPDPDTLEQSRAAEADDRMLREIAESFNREQAA